MKLLTEFHIDIVWWNPISKVDFLIIVMRERIYPSLSMGGRGDKLKLNVRIPMCLGEDLDIHIVV